MRVGTKSVLFGAHAFWLHPWVVAAAWWKLYGFPWDPRLWVAFFVHDLGYWGKPNMDGPEGERHVEWGAQYMYRWFDDYRPAIEPSWSPSVAETGGLLWRGSAFRTLPARSRRQVWHARLFNRLLGDRGNLYWHDLALYHSRFYAKQDGHEPSRLCVADKMVIAIEPWWLYLPRVWLSGELALYRQTASDRREGAHEDPSLSAKEWWILLQAYMRKWVEANRDGGPDTMTPVREESCG